MDFERILKRFFWVEEKETLNLSRYRKKRYNGRDCLKIVGATAESLNKRVLFSSHDLVQSVVSQTVN